MSRQVDNWNDELGGGTNDRFDKIDAQIEKADQTSAEIFELLDRIEAKLERLPRLERLVWGFGSALMIAVVGPRFF
ncbi:MAG: hypothetical protein ACM30E_09980 [Nitrososphaerales archaeon]